MTVDSTIPRGDVVATLDFYDPPTTDKSFQPYNYVTPAPGQEPRNFAYQPHDVPVHDARGHEADFTLDRDAFQILQNQPPSAEQEFVDDQSIAKNHYPEVERILFDNVPGTTKVHIFDHTIRRADPNAYRQPVRTTHIDQTPKSAEQRVRRYFEGEEAERLLKGRYRIINVWQPISKEPVESFPLAYASATTVPDSDIVPVEHRYPDGYTGQTAAILYNKEHKWNYVSGVRPDERILLECFDSASLKPGSTIRGRAAHTAFAHPGTKPDAKPRQSIEVRALVFGP